MNAIIWDGLCCFIVGEGIENKKKKRKKEEERSRETRVKDFTYSSLDQ